MQCSAPARRAPDTRPRARSSRICFASWRSAPPTAASASTATACTSRCMRETALSDSIEAWAQRLHAARAFVIDMDGTIALGDSASGGHRALPGAIELLALLRRRGTPFRIFTNGTAKTPAAYSQSLRRAGFDLRDEEVMTPATSAAHWFCKRGVKKVRALGLGGVQQPLIEAGIEVVQPAQVAAGVEAVFTGWFREFTFPDLEAACRDIWAV